jgi:ribosomal small subunit protein bTHX
LTSADIEGPYYTRALIIAGRAKVEYVCLNLLIWSSNLGKGDKRTFRGKVFKGSHGKTRPRKAKKPAKKPA